MNVSTRLGYRRHVATLRRPAMALSTTSNTHRFKSTTAAAVASSETSNETTLKEVPMLPYLGSIVPQYSKIPPFDRILEFWPGVRKTYGDFYKIGLPGFGKGRDGTMYVINDPNEMMKVLRQEKGSQLPYPRGFIEAEWPLIRHFQDIDSIVAKPLPMVSDMSPLYDDDGFFGRGESWKRMRTFLQTDLLSPQASKRYIPGMVQAAQIASQAAPASVDDLNAFANRCAFDMFISLMFGELSKTANLNSAKSENIEFCDNAVTAMSSMIFQMIDPLQNVMGFMLGMKTSRFEKMAAAWTVVFDMARLKYGNFRDRFENDYDNLTDLEKDSYLAHAIKRQKESTDNFTEEELAEVVNIMLSAAVDTTSAPMSWNLYHIAVNQDVQAKLYDELSSALEKCGAINEEFLKQSTCPYLHAVIRESHRLSPATPVALNKDNPFAEVEIHGTKIPKDSFVSFDNYSVGIDPNIVDNPMEFQPERWMDDAIEARKGTPAEVLDHPLYKSPFSHGSRKCPGSRVANNEVLILLCQLVLDWKITAPSDIKRFEDMDYLLTSMITPKLPKMEFEKRA